MLIDLDHFKEINDTLGHHFGDKLLQEIGPRLSSVLRDNDLMARLGGDEFGIILPDLPSDETRCGSRSVSSRSCEQPIAWRGWRSTSPASIGIALFPMQAEDAEIAAASRRRRDVRREGERRRLRGLRGLIDRHNPQRLTLIGAGAAGARERRVRDVSTSRRCGCRRARRRRRGADPLGAPDARALVPPDEFIPLVEKTVLLRPLTHYVDRDAC